MANWLEFNKGIKELGSQLAERARQKRASEDAIQTLIMQAKIKNMFDPQARLMNYILGGGNEQIRNNVIDTSATDKQGNIVGIDRQKILRGVISKQLNIPYEEMATPKEKEMKIRQKVESEQAEEDIKLISKAKRDLDIYSSDAIQALTALDKIKKQAEKLPKFERGVFPQLGGRISAGFKKFGKDEDITRYLGVVSQELIPMARKLMEERGPITKDDVARVEQGLGDLTTPLEDKIFLLNEFENKVRKAIKNKMQVAKLSPEDFSSKYTILSNRLFDSQDINSNLENIEFPNEQKDIISYYMKKDNRSREEVIKAMQKKGLLK